MSYINCRDLPLLMLLLYLKRVRFTSEVNNDVISNRRSSEVNDISCTSMLRNERMLIIEICKAK
jgi:hypothetical protein